MKTSLTVILALFLVGCAHDKFIRGSGDVGQYVLHEAIVLGGRPVSTNSLPKFASEWDYVQDKSVVVIRLPREQLPAMADFLRQAFGEPSKIIDFTTGGKARAYDVKDIGVNILFGKDLGYGNGYDKVDTFVLVSDRIFPFNK
jgi:hypothetical protein